MKTSDIRRVIDASLAGMKLSPEEREALFERAVGEAGATPPRRKIDPRIARRLLLAAVIAILTLALIVPAVGGQSHQAEFEQTEGALNLLFGHSADSGESFERTSIPPVIGEIWGEEFRNLLVEWKAQALLPHWVPEGFEPAEVNAIPEAYVVDTCLYRDSEYILLNVRVLPDGEMVKSSVWVESDPGTEEDWNLGGVTYHYTENSASSSVSWAMGNCAVYLSASLDKETMRKMIESIYE